MVEGNDCVDPWPNARCSTESVRNICPDMADPSHRFDLATDKNTYDYILFNALACG